MADPKGRYGVSAVGYHFVAGVLEHLPALLALTCPSVNSYRRLQPHSWSSAYTIWGPDNREAAVRIPSTFASDRTGSTNAELKAADASSNPYLALGGLLAAGLDGVTRKLGPGEPVLGRSRAATRMPSARAATSCGSRPDWTTRSTGSRRTPC